MQNVLRTQRLCSFDVVIFCRELFYFLLYTFVSWYSVAFLWLFEKRILVIVTLYSQTLSWYHCMFHCWRYYVNMLFLYFGKVLSQFNVNFWFDWKVASAIRLFLGIKWAAKQTQRTSAATPADPDKRMHKFIRGCKSGSQHNLHHTEFILRSDFTLAQFPKFVHQRVPNDPTTQSTCQSFSSQPTEDDGENR